jgi:hypothetical protein
VAEHLLTRAGTETVKTGQITQWPPDWDNEESPARRLWDAWNEERLRGLGNLDGGKAARKFYKDNKEELTKGMAVSWKERYHASDGVRVGDPDAIYSAMWDYYDLGAMAFMAERQNQPIKEGVTLYTLTPKVICSRVDTNRKPGEVPDWSQMVIAASDVNPSYAISTVIAAFGQDQRSAVLWYGTQSLSVDSESPDAQKQKEIMHQLEIHGRNIASLPCKLYVPPSGGIEWMIDGGGSPQDTINNFALNSKRSCGITSIAAFGRSGKGYVHPAIIKKGVVAIREQSHIKRVLGRKHWVLWNEDYWLEQSQLAWTGATGGPGSCDLPRGSHNKFAEQICEEQLQGKVLLNGRMIYDWNRSSRPHDYGDCMAMLYCLAAINGIGTGGEVVRLRKQQQNRRRVRHVSI